MTDEELRALYGELLAEERASGERPDPTALLDALEGRGSEEERLATLDRALSSATGRRELELLRVLKDAGDPDGPGAVSALPSARPGRPRLAPLALAATLVLAAVGVLRLSTGDGDPGALRSGAAGPELLAPPTGIEADLPVTLVWGAVPGAVEYRVEVMDAAGGLLLEGTAGADTSWVLRELPSRGTVRWWVRAILPTGTPRASGMRELRVR
jgi:hypothetical protein